MTQIIHRPSPNFNARPHDALINLVVIHATESSSAEQDIEWLCNPKSQASAHVVIDRDGTVYELVAPQHRAWHAGVSQYGGRANCNDYSLGIELANRCDGVEPFVDAQLQAAATLVAQYMKDWPAITLDRITRHSDIALPVGRKHDPGPLFHFGDFIALVSEELSRC